MKLRLITALRTTATALERGTFDYDWKYVARCNCGSLFCSLTGKSAADLPIPQPIGGKIGATWKTLVGQHCPITGMPTDKLLKELLGYGLTKQDIINLEFLSDPKVVARMNIKGKRRIRLERKWYQLPRYTTVEEAATKLDYNNKNRVIGYMRAWADLLTEEGKMDVAATEQTAAEQTTP